MKRIDYTDTNLTWLGRWATNNGKYSGFGGSTLAFRFTGTSLSMELDVLLEAEQETGLNVLIDNFDGGAWTHSNSTATSGIQTLIIAENLENKEHIVMMRFWTTNYVAKRDGVDYSKIRAVLVDDNATVSPFGYGEVKLAYFGDSWCSAGNDYTRFINHTKYEIHSISDPGFSSTDGIVRYPYIVGTIPHNDPVFDAVIIGFGVNDAYAGMSDATFKSNVSQIIDKVRLTSPDAKIFLLQSPDNLSTPTVDTSRYGSVMQTLASEKSCYYISTSPIQSQLTWIDDAHLDIPGKLLYGDWVAKQLNPYFPLMTRIVIDGNLVDIPVFEIDELTGDQFCIVVNNNILRNAFVDTGSPNASDAVIYIANTIKAFSKEV